MLMSTKNRLSIRDIADALEVSTTAVSLVLNNKAGNKVSDTVKGKIIRYVEDVGYVPNSSAQSLRTGRSKTIVFMSEDISDPFFSSVAKEMESLAFSEGYKILYCSTENNVSQTKELLAYFSKMEIDAFIITPPDNFENEILDFVKSNKQVTMLFDRYYRSFKHNFVILNNLESAKNGTDFLITRGGRHIAYIGLKSGLSTLKDRKLGYETSIANHGLKSYSLFISFEELNKSEAFDKIKDFLILNPQLDSLMFATNTLAINGLRAIQQLGLKIPENYSVLSFDDRDVFQMYHPGISVINQPVRTLAESLVKNTIKLLLEEKKSAKISTTIHQSNLIIRESTPLKI